MRRAAPLIGIEYRVLLIFRWQLIASRLMLEFVFKIDYTGGRIMVSRNIWDLKNSYLNFRLFWEISIKCWWRFVKIWVYHMQALIGQKNGFQSKICSFWIQEYDKNLLKEKCHKAVSMTSYWQISWILVIYSINQSKILKQSNQTHRKRIPPSKTYERKKLEKNRWKQLTSGDLQKKR